MIDVTNIPALPEKLSGHILGIGTDICEINRIKKIYKQFQEHFLNKAYHPKERDVFNALPEIKKIPFLVKRYAVKEAFSKAIGTGIGEKAFLNEICCLNNQDGQPYLELYGNALKTTQNFATSKGYEHYDLFVSISDEKSHALAFVVICGNNNIGETD